MSNLVNLGGFYTCVVCSFIIDPFLNGVSLTICFSSAIANLPLDSYNPDWVGVLVLSTLSLFEFIAAGQSLTFSCAFTASKGLLDSSTFRYVVAVQCIVDTDTDASTSLIQLTKVEQILQRPTVFVETMQISSSGHSSSHPCGLPSHFVSL
jgi:hypothetical protein